MVLRVPLLLLLLCAGIINFALSKILDASILKLTVCIVIGMSLYQERRTERALFAIRDLSSPRALVVRDGIEMRILGRTVDGIVRVVNILAFTTVVSVFVIYGLNCERLRSVVPDQKLRLVHALKLNGEVVGMTGDGVNDTLALRAADIGIAMGGRGTDFAREAASMVITDDDFTSIAGGIRLGRGIYANLQRPSPM